jgi:cohesin domain-containing protein/PEP-CTERM motif-containing protein
MRLRTLHVSLALLIALAAAPVFATPIISVSPPASVVNVGNTVSVDIVINGAVDLYAFQFDIGFDPSVLSATSIVEGALLPSGGSTIYLPGTISNASGTISFTADTLETAITGVTGSGTLATVSFQAIGAGSSSVNVLNVTLLDSTLSGIADTELPGTIRAIGASAAVPEPSTVALLLTGAVGLSRRVRRRR